MKSIRLRHVWLALNILPGVLFRRQQRALFREMRAFMRTLPESLRAPLPAALQSIAPEVQPTGLTEGVVRDTADLVAVLERRSPLGVCLRRSLTRYRFLRRAGVPVSLHFGAKFVDGKPDREVTGHAWLTLDGAPYHEAGENWRGFSVMLSFPQSNS